MNAIFVAPFLMETTLRFVEAAASLPGVRLVLVSQDPESKIPDALRAKLAGHWRLDDGLDATQIAGAARALSDQMGKVERVIGTLEQLQVPLAEVRDMLDIPGMRTEAAMNFRDKARMKTLLSDAGIPCARHQLVQDVSQATDFAAHVGYPLVAKPQAGAGAINTFRIDDQNELSELLAAQPPTTQSPTLFEEFIIGDEYSFDSVFVEGRMVWHSISHYLPTPLDVLQNPWIQWVVMLPRVIEGPAYDDIRSEASSALLTLGMQTGLSHMEWFRRHDGSVAISEVGARPPGAQITTLISYAHDTDFYEAWARLMITGEFTPPERLYSVGAAFLRGQGSGRVQSVTGIDQLRDVAGLVVEARLPQRGQTPTGTYEGDGYVVVRHAETSVVEKALAELVTTIRVELGS